MNTAIPKRLQGILQSININKLDIKRDKSYIIHEILSEGRMEDIQWLFEQYPADTVKHVFLTTPYKSYRKPRLRFVKNMLLSIQKPVLENRYVINTPRDIR